MDAFFSCTLLKEREDVRKAGELGKLLNLKSECKTDAGLISLNLQGKGEGGENSK